MKGKLPYFVAPPRETDEMDNDEQSSDEEPNMDEIEDEESVSNFF